MNPMDIVRIPGTNMYTRRIVYDKWVQAGSPPINDAGRLYQQQLDARLAFEAGRGSPADDPRYPDRYPLAHVRFAALDIDATPARVAALSAAGLVRPYSYEPWHWQLPNIYNYPLVTSIPASAANGSTLFPTPTIPQEDEMAYPISLNNKHFFMLSPGYVKHFSTLNDATITRNIVTQNDQWIELNDAQFLGQLDSFGIPRDKVDIVNGQVFDVGQNKMVKGGMWSWARDAAWLSAGIYSKLNVVPTPPTVPDTSTPVEPPKE